MGGPKDWSPAEHAKKKARDAENQAYAELTTLFGELRDQYPEIGLTFGYIGNYESWGDDRHWYFFTEVPIQGNWGMDRMKFGSYKTADLPLFSKLAKEKLKPWIQTQVLPRLKKESGGRMSGPKDWQPQPLSIDDTRVAALRSRIRTALQEADHAFWAEIVKHFPEVESGDFGPDDTFKWDNAMEEALMTWLGWNYPHEFLLKPIIDHLDAGRSL